MSYEKIEGAKVSGNQFLTYGRALHVGGRRGLTVPGTVDEIKRVTIAIEKSVEVAPLLVARLGVAVVSCDSAK